MCIRDREKDPNYSETREITSTSGINGSVTFLEWVDDINYSLQIKELDVPESLSKENVKYLVDIFFLNDKQEIVEVNGFKIKVKFKMPDNLKDYDTYKIVFTRNGKIIEQLDATVEDGYIIFETTHLSNYGTVSYTHLPTYCVDSCSRHLPYFSVKTITDSAFA